MYWEKSQRFFPHQAMPRLDAQVQFQFAVDPVDALVVPVERLHVAQVQEAQSEASTEVKVRKRRSKNVYRLTRCRML